MKRKDLINILKLARFHFILGGFFSFTSGTLLAILLNVPFSLERFVLGFTVLMSAQLSVSYSNDYFDVDVDKHGKPTIFTGGSGILIDNPHLRPLAYQISIVLFGLSLFLAVIFTLVYETPLFLVMSLMGLFLSWYYSAPPLKLSYHGLGELVMVITGFLVPTMGYLTIAGIIDLKIVIFTLPLMLYQLVFILNAEMPDLESDVKGGKHTFVVNNGRITGFKMIGIFGVLATLLFIFIGLSGEYTVPDFKILALISLIPTIFGLWSYWKRTTQKEAATSLANHSLAGLFASLILVDAYFLLLFNGLY